MHRKVVLALIVLCPSVLISTMRAQDTAKPSQSAQRGSCATDIGIKPHYTKRIRSGRRDTGEIANQPHDFLCGRPRS